MPIYEYRCKDCDGEFELLLKGSETPLCPECDSAALERLLSVFGVSSASPVSSPGSCNTCGDPRGPGT